MGQPQPDMRLVEMESNLQLVASREVPVHAAITARQPANSPL